MNKILDKMEELEKRIKLIEDELHKGKIDVSEDDGWTKCGEGLIYLDTPEDGDSNRGSDSERKWPHNMFA